MLAVLTHTHASADILPEHVEDLSPGVEPDEHVRHGDKLKLAVLGVREVHLGLPDGLDEVGIVQVQRCGDVFVAKARVGPVLPQVQVHLVVLAKTEILVLRLGILVTLNAEGYPGQVNRRRAGDQLQTRRTGMGGGGIPKVPWNLSS